MIEDVARTLEASVFVRYPGFVWAPFMLIGASLVSYLFLAWRHEPRPRTLRDVIESTFALSGWRSRSALADVVLFLSRKLLPSLASNGLAFALAGGAIYLLGGMGAQPSASTLGPWGILGAALMLVVLFDLGDYLAHLALHRIPLLWELHKVHHSATFLSPATSFRVHPCEALIYTAGHSVIIAPLLAGLSFYYRLNVTDLIDLMFTTNLAILVLTFNHLKHSHAQISLGPLDYVLISPHMHQLHHSSRLDHWDKNLGLIFSAWDWIFGTAVREDTRVPVVYGIGRGPEIDAQYTTLYGMFLLPLVNMTQKVLGRLPAETRPKPDAGSVGGSVTSGA